ncbi:jg22808 [Pararge aegeria aegeria]|uniref:Jg22808 protein n=1 Tax=Pararge aegeria aegeria TaxID=348720 RepID=A0A8S4RXV2_9NEOP|nr:jg22808 [Pararge aegeria aegeria]
MSALPRAARPRVRHARRAAAKTQQPLPRRTAEVRASQRVPREPDNIASLMNRKCPHDTASVVLFIIRPFQTSQPANFPLVGSGVLFQRTAVGRVSGLIVKVMLTGTNGLTRSPPQPSFLALQPGRTEPSTDHYNS